MFLTGITIASFGMFTFVYMMSRNACSAPQKNKPIAKEQKQEKKDILQKVEAIKAKMKNQDELLAPILEKNKKGQKQEKDGDIDKAIRTYKLNVKYIKEHNEELEKIPTHSFDRLVILYRKKKDYKNEAKICNLYIKLMEPFHNQQIQKCLQETGDEYKEKIMEAAKKGEPLKNEKGIYIYNPNTYAIIKYQKRLLRAKELGKLLEE